MKILLHFLMWVLIVSIISAVIVFDMDMLEISEYLSNIIRR